MQLTGQAVKHRIFGKGVITENTDTCVTVLFADCEKKFLYPDAFNKFLTLKDEKLQKAVKGEYIEEQKEELIEKEKINAKYERLDKLRTIKNSANSQAVFNVSKDEVSDIIDKSEIFTGCYASGERKGLPKQAVRIKPNSACVITTLEEGKEEKERRVAGIFMVDESFYGSSSKDGIIKGHEKYKFLLPDDTEFKLWDYDDNHSKIQNWGKTTFKYMTNTSIGNLIFDIAKKMDTDFARTFYKYYCLVNQLTEKSFIE